MKSSIAIKTTRSILIAVNYDWLEEMSCFEKANLLSEKICCLIISNTNANRNPEVLSKGVESELEERCATDIYWVEARVAAQHVDSSRNAQEPCTTQNFLLEMWIVSKLRNSALK